MKKSIFKIIVLSCLLLSSMCMTTYAQNEDSMNATWITTVYNKDWPKNKSNPEEQKREMRDMLDNLKDVGINTVMFQARAKGDALYNSSINPWSDILTGTQGKNPGYDPLEYIIREAKLRGMKVHVWLNPYRVTTSGTDLNKLSYNHPARKNPNWVISYDNRLYYNPELNEVKQHIVDTVSEIVKNYDIDGIHFDDYFYPANYPLPAGEGKDGYVANKRRDHINEMIINVKNEIKSVNSNVKFGVSPRGIWKNKYSDPKGSDTRGAESYYSDYADTIKWIENEWVDYIVPQIYWEIGHNAADYSKLVKWWSDKVDGSKVSLYIGHGIYKDEVANEIDTQIDMNKRFNNIKGSVFYTTSDILENRKGCREKIKNKLINKIYYLDINSFLGDYSVDTAIQRLKADTGWYLEKKTVGDNVPVYELETGGFTGEDNVKSAVNIIKSSTGFDATYAPNGIYLDSTPLPIFMVETGGFYGEDNVKESLKKIQADTGWWGTYKQSETLDNTYHIILGGFDGEDSVKSAVAKLQNDYGWWSYYYATGEFTNSYKIPVYSIKVSNILSNNEAQSLVNKLQNDYGWWSHYYNSGYINYYRIITGGFVGMDTAKAQSDRIKRDYGWYNEIKEQ